MLLRALDACHLLGACAVLAQDHPSLQPVAADLVPYVERRLREVGILGVCVAVLDIDPTKIEEQLQARAFGTLTPTGGVMRADAIHRVAASSKFPTATAARKASWSRVAANERGCGVTLTLGSWPTIRSGSEHRA